MSDAASCGTFFQAPDIPGAGNETHYCEVVGPHDRHYCRCGALELPSKDGQAIEPVREDDQAAGRPQGRPEPQGVGSAHRPQEVRQSGYGEESGGGAPAGPEATLTDVYDGERFDAFRRTLEHSFEMGEEFDLLIGPSWARKVRVVRVTDTGPYTREYTLREIDNGHQVLHTGADEEELHPNWFVRAYTVVKRWLQGHEDAQGRHEDRPEVGGDHGTSRRVEVDRPGQPGSGGQARRQEADREGLHGPVGEGRLRPQQAGLADRGGQAFPEGPVLGRFDVAVEGSGGAGAVGLPDDRLLDHHRGPGGPGVSAASS